MNIENSIKSTSKTLKHLQIYETRKPVSSGFVSL